MRNAKNLQPNFAVWMDSLFPNAYNLLLHQVRREPDRLNGRAVNDSTPDVALRRADAKSRIMQGHPFYSRADGIGSYE